MKQLISYCSASVVALLLLAACTEDYASSSGGRMPLQLTAGTAAGTRAATNIQSTVFDQGETLNAYITVSGSGEVIAAPAVYTTEAPSGGKNELTPAVQPYFPMDQSKTLDIYALYPSTVTSGTTTFAVSPDQTVADGGDATQNGYKASDLMYASLSGVARTTGATKTTADLVFSHKMVKFIVQAVVDDASVGTVSSVKLKGVYRRIGLDATTGVLGDDGTLADQGDIVFNSTSGNSTDESACLFPPQSLQRGDFLEVQTTGGTAKFALVLTAAKTFTAGSVIHVELHIGAANLRETATIDEWPDDYNLKVEALGAGNIQIDEIADIDPNDASTYDSSVAGQYRPLSVTVCSGSTVLTEGTDYTLEYFNNTAAGDYGVVVATGLGTYDGRTAARSFLIKAGTISYAPEPQAATGLVYDGTPKSLVDNSPVAQKSGDNGIVPIKYSLTENGYYSTTIPTATNAGTYTVYYKVDDTDGFQGIAKRSFSVTIAKAAIAAGNVTAPTANTLTYNEKYQNLVTAGSSSEGTMTYCLGTNATTAPTSGYTTDVPTALNAGTYYVWWQVGDDNHEGTTPQCITVTIEKSNGRINLSPTLITFYAAKGTKRIVTLDFAGDGSVSLNSNNTTDIGLSINSDGTKITVIRLTDRNVLGINVAVHVSESQNYKASDKSFTVNLDRLHLKLSDIKSTDQKYLGYLVSTTGYIYPASSDGLQAIYEDGPNDGDANAQPVGIITYIGTGTTAAPVTRGYVMALKDCNDGTTSTCTFSQTSAFVTSSVNTPAVSGYTWQLGTKERYQTAMSQMNSISDETGNWTDIEDPHWTSSSGHNDVGYIRGQYVYTVDVNYEWVYTTNNYFWKNYATNNNINSTHIDECRVRPLFAF